MDEQAAPPTAERALPKRFSPWRLLPLALLVLALAAAYALDVGSYLTIEALRANRGRLLAWVDRHDVLAPAVYVAVYAVAIVVVPPSGAAMTVAGGFIFGVVAATGFVVIGATAGATVLFLVAKTSLGDWLRARAGPGLRKMEAGFRENELSYMLVLRLIPLFPFWLVNLAPAFLGVRLSTFVVGTFFGIVPGTAVFALCGAGLGTLLDAGGDISLEGVLTPEIVLGLVGLAALVLLPVGYKKWKARKG
jgi:uncharacterized membrane protein YdjX (TVP38/TMEM64 family)